MCLLRKYGEPLKLSSLTKCHTEGRRVRRDIKQVLVVTEAPSVRGATEIVYQFCQQFIYKAFIPKELSEICTLHLRRSLCHRHLCDIVFISVLSVALCALLYKRFSLSLHISEEPYLCRAQFHICGRVIINLLIIVWRFSTYGADAQHVWCERLTPMVRMLYKLAKSILHLKCKRQLRVFYDVGQNTHDE